MSHVRLIHGDALEVLEGLDECSFDACLCDPPYGIGFMGKKWDRPGATFFERKAQRTNRFDHVGGNHNPTSGPDRARTRSSENVKFQDWCEAWSLAVLRCLRPGASLMAFGGTRTYHRLAVAVEDAGFEIRDSILVPGVAWTFGAGFPKSLDVSKAIDKAAGAERRVVGRAVMPNGQDHPGRGPSNTYSQDEWTKTQGRSLGTEVTALATPEAARWKGYGAALKPAQEPIVWAMKPVDATFARNALEHGVAGVNVDAGRIATDWTTDPTRRGWQGGKRPHTSPFDSGDTSQPTVPRPGPNNAPGRFPANLILAHLPGCRRKGTKRVEASAGVRGASSRIYGGGKGFTEATGETVGYADPDGTEEVPAWRCVEGCPVLAMDRASGESVNGGPIPKTDEQLTSYDGGWKQTGSSGRPGDSGTASRFFKQVSWEPGEFERTLLYYSKAPTSERMVGGERLLHPTMKPLALATYLARMLLPPPREDGEPRRLLVPFSGVGSEVIGALRAGWDEVVAIELDADGEGWVEKSARRIKDDAPLLNTVEIESPGAKSKEGRS